MVSLRVKTTYPGLPPAAAIILVAAPFFSALIAPPPGSAYPVAAWAHTGLRGSTPAAGAELDGVPGELRLTFSEPISLALTRIELEGPGGEAVSLLAPTQPADSPQVVVVAIAGILEAGEYRVAWQTAGRDGHPVRGQFGFTIAASAFASSATSAAGVVADEASAMVITEMGATPASTSPAGTLPARGFGVGSPLYILIRLLTFVGVLGIVGVVSFRALVLPRFVRKGTISATGGRLLVESVGSTPARLGVALSAVLGVAVLLRGIAQGYALGDGRFDLPGLRAMLVGSPWGWGWVAQGIGVVVAWLGFRWASRGRSGGWVLAGAAALILAGTLGLSGHAAGVQRGLTLALLADAGHVLGAGGWLGTLLVLVGIGVPAALRLDDEGRSSALAGLVHAFSALALVCAALVIATGLIGAWLHLGTLQALWGTGYGRALLVKLGSLTVVFGAGAYNFLRVRPELGGVSGSAGAARLRRVVAVELTVAVVVLLITAVLVALPTPV